MKRKILLIAAALLCTFAFAIEPGTAYVSCEKIQLHAKPKATSKAVKKLYYGNEVTVVLSKGKWAKIVLSSSDDSTSGWIQSSALTKRKIVAKGSKVSASTSELALAGKGFSSEVEGEYKKKGKANYTAVDAMEKNEISTEELEEFIEDGKLNGGE
ncbi:MAG: SH3 domain-containing protein [Treponema sp.]